MEDGYKRDSLENDVKSVLVPRHALILDDTRVRKTLDEVDLFHQLRDLSFPQPGKVNPLDCDHLARTQI